jgi:hypothetical protein
MMDIYPNQNLLAWRSAWVLNRFCSRNERNKLSFAVFQAKRVMSRLDNDGDGKLDFEEFQKFIKPKKSARRFSNIEWNISKDSNVLKGAK